MASESFEDIPEEVETAVTRPISSKVSPRPKSATKKRFKGGSSKSSPYKNFGSTSALQSSKNAREAWLSAAKGGGSTTGSKKGFIDKRTPTERYTDTLRRTGVGITGGTMGKREGLSNLKKSSSQDMSYASTSHYLRQLAGTEKLSKSASMDTTVSKPSPGTPAYKSKEEYYDEVIALKKQIQHMNSDASTLKLKIRRIEEDNIKKQKEIEQLLDPSKSEEMRRTLTDRRPDAGTVMHSLKQKILKLEHQLKDREAAYSKLQSDIKTTKIDELKTQNETLYREVLRLNQLKSVPANTELSRTSSRASKENPSKIKALQETIVRMNEKNVRLATENKTLRQDLQNVMENRSQLQEKNKEYEEMSKKELLTAVTKLEKRLDRAEAENLSIVSDVDDRRSAVEGKIVLEGSVAQRLDQLDRRETELLEEMEKQKTLVKRLKDDRTHYRKKCDEKDREIKLLKKEIEELQAEVNSFYDKDKVPTPRPSARARPRRDSKGYEQERLRKAEQLKENHAAKQIQRGWRSHRQKRQDEEDERRKAAELEMKLASISEARAAKTIQRQWRSHKKEEQIKAEQEEAAELIQSAMRGHRVRQANLNRMRGYMAEDDPIEETESDDATSLLQSSLRGHSYRKDYIKRGSIYDSPRSTSPRQHARSISPPHNKRFSPRRLDSAGEEEDSDDIKTVSSYRRGSARSGARSPPRPSSNPRRKSRTPTPLGFGSDDDDDDLIVTSGGKKFF